MGDAVVDCGARRPREQANRLPRLKSARSPKNFTSPGEDLKRGKEKLAVYSGLVEIVAELVDAICIKLITRQSPIISSNE